MFEVCGWLASLLHIVSYALSANNIIKGQGPSLDFYVADIASSSGEGTPVRTGPLPMGGDWGGPNLAVRQRAIAGRQMIN